ncbi:hypothetical protein QYE76_024854 [Lolium multiflorum]|uniref:Uncharacterized protein n=1 Tax=Lolium multiflorum TaxID=4521 RepID=A0AAD8VTM8_LOLMU|nr:hypothetical protein QYE76_024854 [Lolium multiflorum]
MSLWAALSPRFQPFPRSLVLDASRLLAGERLVVAMSVEVVEFLSSASMRRRPASSVAARWRDISRACSRGLRLLVPLRRLLLCRLSFRICNVGLVPRREPWVLAVVRAVVCVGLRLQLRLRWWWRRRRQRAVVEAKHGVHRLQTARHF